MRRKFDEFVKKYGYSELFCLFVYPIILPALMLRDTSFSIINIIKALHKYNWKYLSANDQKNSYNNLFYYTQDYNIQKHGRYGSSDLLAGGSYSLKNWFHATPLSLRLQASLGTTFIMFFAMSFWLGSWIVLYQDNTYMWLILGMVLFSSLFFATFIEIQNYNILGWMLYPLFLSFMAGQDYLALAFVLLFMALLSFTAFFISGILMVVSFIYALDYFLLLSLLPGGIKWVFPIIVSIKEGALSKMFALIGGHDEVKYKRKTSKNLTINKLYILVLMIQFNGLIFYSYGVSQSALLLLTITSLFVINELLSRFADQQSFYLAYLSVSLFYLIGLSDVSGIVLLSFAFSIFPIYGLLGSVAPIGKGFISPGVRVPFNSKNTLEGLGELFSVVPEGSRVIMAYKNPDRQHSNIFNKYRIFMEPIQYAATTHNICVFPDWYMVLENNTKTSDESFWVDSYDKVMAYMEKHRIDYVLVPDFLGDIVGDELRSVGDFEFVLTESLKSFQQYRLALYERKNT